MGSHKMKGTYHKIFFISTLTKISFIRMCLNKQIQSYAWQPGCIKHNTVSSDMVEQCMAGSHWLCHADGLPRCIRLPTPSLTWSSSPPIQIAKDLSTLWMSYDPLKESGNDRITLPTNGLHKVTRSCCGSV